MEKWVELKRYIEVEVTALIELGMGLILLLAVLIFFLFQQRKRARRRIVPHQESIPSFESLIVTIKDKTATTEQLSESLNTIINYYGTIENIDIYSDIVYRICKHPHTQTALILQFDKELRKRNPHYQKEINSAISEGLSSRE